MRTIESWLSEYSESHQHPVNIAIHKIAVPLVMLSVLGLAGSVSLIFPFLLVVGAIAFYFRLSTSLAIGMLVLSAIELRVVYWMDGHLGIPLWLVSLLIFAFAWILQFIGHAVEGKRPSFMKDLWFLLIGPAWVITPIYRLIKVRL